MNASRMVGLCGCAALFLLVGLSHVQTKAAQTPPVQCSLSLAYVVDATEASHHYIYVLEQPGYCASAYEVFDSAQMENALASLPKGAVLTYVGQGLMDSRYAPTRKQFDAFSAFCRQHNINLVEAPLD